MSIADLINSLISRLPREEMEARAARALPPQHILDFSQFPVSFATETLAALDSATSRFVLEAPHEGMGHLVRAFTLVLLGDMRAADAEMAAYQMLSPADPKGHMRFASLPEGKPVELPTVLGDLPTRATFFIGCDKRYLQIFAMPLLRSLASTKPGSPVHLHLMDVNPRLVERIEKLDLKITSTTEDPTAFVTRWGLDPKDYYNAARILRFAQAAAESTETLCLVDADALATQDPTSLLAPDIGIAMRVRAGRFEPFHHFSACLVAANREPSGFAAMVASIVGRLIYAPFWGLDQYALFLAHLLTKPSLTLIGPDTASVDPEKPGTFWFTAAAAKSSLTTDATAYAKLFRRYSGLSP